MAKIAECESGGNPTAVSPSGQYRGKYQFSQETWESLGGTGDPAEADESVQDMYAAGLYQQRGLAPWPACSAQVQAELDAAATPPSTCSLIAPRAVSMSTTRPDWVTSS